MHMRCGPGLFDLIHAPHTTLTNEGDEATAVRYVIISKMNSMQSEYKHTTG